MTLDWSSQPGPANRIRRSPPGQLHPASYSLHFGSFCSTLWKCYSKTLGRGLCVGTEAGHAAILPPAWGHVPRVWRNEAAGFKHDGALRDNNYCILKHWNYSEQWKPVPGPSKHMFPWGGQGKAWGNRFRPEQMRDNTKCLSASEAYGSWCFHLLIQEQGSHQNCNLIYEAEALSFAKSFLFIIGSRYPFSFLPNRLFPDWLVDFLFSGAKAVSFVTQPCSVTWVPIHNWSF